MFREAPILSNYRLSIGYSEQLNMEPSKYLFSRRADPFLLPLIIMLGLILWLAVSLIPLSAFVLLQKLVGWTAGNRWHQAICCIALTAVGFALHRFRQRARLLYGEMEIIVAFGGFWFALGTTANLKSSAAAVIASLYVMVRGIENYSAGITEQHRRMGLDDQHRPLPGRVGK
jgi:hypothetical protein